MRQYPSLTEPRKDKRIVPRINIRHGDGVSGLINPDSDDSAPLRIFDVSLAGFSVIADPDQPVEIEPEATYPLVLQRSWDHPLHINAKCLWSKSQSDNQYRYGFQFTPSITDAAEPEDDTRQSDQIPVPADMPIQAYLFKEIFYRERQNGRIVSISKYLSLIHI